MNLSMRFKFFTLLMFLLIPFAFAHGVPISLKSMSGSLDPSEVSIDALGQSASAQFPNLKQKLSDGQFSALVSEAQVVIREHPNSVLAFEVLGTAYLYQGKLQEAEDAFRKGLGNNQKNAEMWAKLGIALMEQDKLQAAQDAFLQSLELDQQNRVAHQRLGLIHEYKGNTDDAIFHLRQGLKGTPLSYLGVAVNLGRLLNEQNEYDQTVSILGPRVSSATKVLAEAWLILATAQLQTNDPESAEASFLNWQRENPNSKEGLIGLAMAQRQSGQLDKAIDTLDKLVQSGKTRPSVYIFLSELLVAQGYVEKALSTLASASDTYPGSAYIQVRRGNLLAATGNYEGAVGALQTADTLSEGDPLVLNSLLLAQARSGKADGAVDTASRLLVLNPGHASVNFLYASRLEVAGHTQKAIHAYEQLLAIDPGHSPGLNNLANLKMASGAYDESVELAAAAVASGGENARFLDTLGWAYYRQGDVQNALGNLRKAASLEPGNATIRYHLGAALIASGQERSGKKELERAIAINGREPWREEAKQLLN